MSVSNKPIIWSLFAAGGTVTALLTPVLILIFALAVPFGLLDAETFSYTRLHLMLECPLIRLVVFGVLFLSLWHSAHRLRITLHDFGIRADGLAVFLFYGVAAIATVLLGIALI
ncbi:MAG: fumarate reductase subunit D [Gammaproteobacteria bacterium]|nr:MAG: fumarate reductase subunit D [Gammaproteobacteria bacterium]